MEPTLHCARGASAFGCLARVDDLVVARLTGAKDVQRRDIVVFNTPSEAALRCGEGGTFVKRVIGLSGETVREDDHGLIWFRHPGSSVYAKLSETYISVDRRLADSAHFGKTWRVPNGEYFVMGDNRAQSCDSRDWGRSRPKHQRVVIVAIIAAVLAIQTIGQEFGQARRRRRGDSDARRRRRRSGKPKRRVLAATRPARGVRAIGLIRLPRY
jgi:signal peptidase I